MSLFQEIFSFWQAAGWYAIPLYAISTFSSFWLISLFFKLSRSSFRTTQIESEITQKLVNGESHNSILSWLQQQKGMVPRIISYVFAGTRSPSSIRQRFIEASSSEVNALNKEFGLLSSLVKAAPLLGLLGTVAGMIQTFSGMAGAEGTDSMAAGISKALLTTQLGLLVALPGFFGIEYLKRKFNRLTIELDRLQFHINALTDKSES